MHVIKWGAVCTNLIFVPGILEQQVVSTPYCESSSPILCVHIQERASLDINKAEFQWTRLGVCYSNWPHNNG